MGVQYKHCTVAGTFDRLHAGHLALITRATQIAQRVSIGITTDAFCTLHAKSPFILPYETRKKEVEQALSFHSLTQQCAIFPLDDMYGIARHDATLDSIVVTVETQPNALKINDYRIHHDLPILAIDVIDFTRDERQNIISSTNIREGIMNRNGSLYFPTLKTITISPSTRATLAKPFDTLISQDIVQTVAKLRTNFPRLFITVGDIVSQTFLHSSEKPHIAIIDHKTRRSAVINPIATTAHAVENPAGTITKEAEMAILASIEFIKEHAPTETIILRIEGEEDLLTLPAILACPLQSLVMYGQPDHGVVAVPVTEENKEKAKALIS